MFNAHFVPRFNYIRRKDDRFQKLVISLGRANAELWRNKTLVDCVRLEDPECNLIKGESTFEPSSIVRSLVQNKIKCTSVHNYITGHTEDLTLIGH